MSSGVAGPEVQMYGTTMIGTLASGVTVKDVEAEMKAWEAQHHPAGYVSSHVMVADDGKTVINVAMFENQELYMALADSPEQDEWWQKHYAPLLDGEPRWIDGSWIS
jgi:antibiotic biosynthesis monooxygenase (ABM) superfamily enzyme